MDPSTGSISFINKMGIVLPDCNPSVQACYGNTVRSLYMGPDQELYGTTWEISASIVPTFLYKIDKTNANAQIVCQFLPFFLFYQTVGIGIDSTGIMYWKRPGTNDVRMLDMTTCIISGFSLDFNATASTLYFDKLYFIDPAGRMLRIDPPVPSVVDTGYDTGIIYGVPQPIIGPGPSATCFLDDQCWAPTILFPYINAAYQTDLRAGYGTPDKSSEPFYVVDPDTTTTTLFLNRSITGTGQIVYGAAPTCYHNISVNIPDIVKRAPMSVSPGDGVLYLSAPIPAGYPAAGGGGGSLLSLYARSSNMALPVGRMGYTENITKLMMSPGGQLYGVSAGTNRIYTISGGGALSLVCTMSNVNAVFGFQSLTDVVLVQDGTGAIRAMDPDTCTLAVSPIAMFDCDNGAVVNGILYCVGPTDVTSITVFGVVTTLGSHGATFTSPTSSPRPFKYCHDGGVSSLVLFHDHQFSDVSAVNGSLSNTVPFTLGSGSYDWYPESSVWCA